MDDVYCNHHQLCLLFSCCAVGKEKTNDRYADDAQNDGLYLDDLYGADIDWADIGGLVMEENFDIQKYMTQGVERIVADSWRGTLKDPRESAFRVKFAASSKKASKIKAEE